MGTQMCMHDGSGFEPCMCAGTSDASGTSGGSGGGSSDTSVGGSGSSGLDPDTGTGADGSTGMGTTAASEETGPVGSPPTAQINHPGDGEQRQVGVPIPFIGVANDPEDGVLTGASLVWTDSIEARSARVRCSTPR
jgi:hypothetical protein